MLGSGRVVINSTRRNVTTLYFGLQYEIHSYIEMHRPFDNTVIKQTVSIDDPSRIGIIIRAVAYKYLDYKCTLTNAATKRIIATAQYGRHYTLTNIYEVVK